MASTGANNFFFFYGGYIELTLIIGLSIKASASAIQIVLHMKDNLVSLVMSQYQYQFCTANALAVDIQKYI